MGIAKKAGDSLVRTSSKHVVNNSDTIVCVYEGSRSAVEAGTLPAYGSPDGYTECARETLVDGGLGKLAVTFRKFDDAQSVTPVRTTFRVTMVETTYELQCHPKIAGTAAKARLAAMWLATDEAERVTVANDTASYRYRDAEGELTAIADADVRKFCAAYLAGIRTYVRHYPVIEKISVLRNPQGLSVGTNGSFSSGTLQFSDEIGTYDAPDVSLAGYAANKWFKSRDDYVQNEDRSWTRTEQWTYTPEPSTGDHAWIYAAESEEEDD